MRPVPQDNEDNKTYINHREGKWHKLASQYIPIITVYIIRITMVSQVYISSLGQYMP